MPRIDKLTITGFKSIAELRDFELGKLNVLIGANGAGKSNFIGLFRMLGEMADKRLQLYVQKQGGPDAILHYTRKTTDCLRGEFVAGDQRYQFALVPTNDRRLIFQEERWTSTTELFDSALQQSAHGESAMAKVASASGHAPMVRDWRVYHFHDTSDAAKVRQAHAANDTLVLKPDAANLGAFVAMLSREHPAAYERIVETVRLVAPFFGGFIHRKSFAQTIELEWFEQRDPDTPLTSHAMSDGTLRFVSLATLLLQPAALRPATILIDEPELGLHPYAIQVLGDMLKQASESTQLIVSTQSVELLNCFEPDDVIVVDRANDASTFKRLNQQHLATWLEDYTLGDLWKQNVIGGRPA